MADWTLVLLMVSGIILVSTGGVVALLVAAAYARRTGEPAPADERRTKPSLGPARSADGALAVH